MIYFNFDWRSEDTTKDWAKAPKLRNFNFKIEGEGERQDLPLGENGVVFGSLVLFSLVYSGDDGEETAVAEIHSDDTIS